MSERIQLNRLVITGFRGSQTPVEIPLEKKLNILTGPNGSGKSTTTTGIEYALFPRATTLQKEHCIDERRDWEVKNLHGDTEASLTLTLTKGSQQIEIQRSTAKASPLDPQCHVRCTYADFKGLVFIHQETLRDFLVGPPSVRERAFQRLLGVGWSQDLISAIGKAVKKLNCDQADQQVQNINNVLDARLSEARRQLEQTETETRAKGVGGPWDQARQKQAENAEDLVKSLCQELSVPAPLLPKVNTIHGYSGRLASVLQKLRGQGPARKHGELASRKTRIEAARCQYRAAKEAMESARAAYESAVKQAGSEQQLTVRKADLKEAEVKLLRTRADLNRQLAVVQEALGYFKALPKTDTCPVCSNKVSGSIVDELDQHLLALSSEQDRKIREELETVRKRLDGLDQTLATLRSLKTELERASTLLSKACEVIHSAIGREISSDEDPLAVADGEIKRLETEIAVVSKAVKEQQDRINQIEAIARLVDEIDHILALRQRVESLGQIRRIPEWAAMIKAEEALAQYEQILRHAESSVKILGAAIAQENLNRAMEPITKFYQKLTQRADFSTVTIDPANGFVIQVRGQRGTYPATALLNLTDLNSLAIAVVAGMATTFSETHDLGFLILDDPSQGMDATVSRRLGEVISDLSAKIQVVVATPDPHLLQALEQSPRQKNVIYLKPRDSNMIAPCVEVESVRS